MLADVASISLERHRFIESIEELQKESLTDALTGLGNRRHFERRMLSEISRARRFGQPLSLIMLDIDDFKVYNDTYGHPTGDAMLRGLAQVMLDNVRTIDDVIRYGGEEFVMILPETDRAKADVVLNRLRTGTEDLPELKLGLAVFPEDGTDPRALLSSAAKAAGDNFRL